MCMYGLCDDAAAAGTSTVEAPPQPILLVEVEAAVALVLLVPALVLLVGSSGARSSWCSRAHLQAGHTYGAATNGVRADGDLERDAGLHERRQVEHLPVPAVDLGEARLPARDEV